MILNKSLLLKCLGGVAACTGVAGIGILGSQSGLGGTSSTPAAVTNDQTTTDLGTLIANVGLSGCTSTDGTNNECTIGADGLNVKQGESKKEKNKKTNSTGASGKIKVSKDSNTSSYNQGFKFVIEGGDITLTGGSNSPTVTKLEQFETYEIKKEDSGADWYFSRVTEAKDGIKTALGLPSSCTLDNDCSEKEINTNELKAINFEGKDNTATVSVPAILTVTKLSTPEEDFPFGYKFSFKGKDSNAILTLSGSKTISLDTTNGTEFKIKKPATGNNITLEEAWTKERLLEKVGLECNENNECTQKTGENINIRFEDNDKLDKKTLDTNNGGSIGKIKVSKESTTTTYNHGFKFVIEEKDISITGESTKKLEQFETYEIKEDGTGENKKWYFSRKTKAKDGIKTALGLPSDCSLPDSETSTCTINTNNISTIKFDGGNSNPSITVTATLTVTKESSNTEFPYGYKFGFKASSSSSGSTTTLTIGGKQITLKSAEDTEFKIKKGTSGNDLTLTEVWTLETLAKKVNLTCSNNECTQISGQTTNIKKDTSLDGKTLTTSTGSGKIKVYTGTEATDYNKGFKFVIEGGDVSTDDNNTKLEEFETYEIKEESSKWYFYRKDKAEKEIKKLLGLPNSGCDFPTGGNNTSSCCDLDTDKLKKINFDGKGTDGATVNNGGTSPTLKISITSTEEKTQFPFGYKFTLISDKEITLNTEGPKSIKASTNTEFKIKATPSTSNGTARTLSLEKAWNAKSLGEKVGLTCDEGSSKECSLPTSKNINVTFGSDDKKENATIQDDDATKKLKYEEDQEGCNQGIRFYADEDINLNESKKIDKKGDNGTATYYEIKQDAGTWYLTKHTNS